LLGKALDSSAAYVSGRYFPYADRPSVLVDGTRKYWFRVNGIAGAGHRLCVVITRVTDLEDGPLNVDVTRIDPRSLPAFEHLQSTFWRFLRPSESTRQDCATP
jgi:hypothetical protein